MMLADMGADIVRIEAPDRPDLARMTPPFEGEVSAAHAWLNRSKRSLALNLKAPGAVEVVKRLVMDYDIVLEQFRPGVMDRLGVGYEALRAANPRVIYCALTGYGQSGPYRDRAGHDNNYLALSGVLSHSGTVEGGPPPLGVQIADVSGGSKNAVIGILAAVIHRERTGEGQFVDVSMFDGAVAMNAFAASQCLASGEAPTRESMLLNGGSHYGCYRTKDGRYLSVGSLEPKFWEGFCEAIGRSDLIARLSEPGPAMAPVIAEIRAVIAARTLAEWVAVFAGRDVCVEPVLDLNETFAHPQVRARDMVVEVPRDGGGVSRQAGSAIRFSSEAPVYRYAGRPLGADTEAVLREAGYDDGGIAALRAAGALG